MNANRVFDIFASIVVVTLVTTLILPGRQTQGVIREGGSAFSGILRASQGR